MRLFLVSLESNLSSLFLPKSKATISLSSSTLPSSQWRGLAWVQSKDGQWCQLDSFMKLSEEDLLDTGVVVRGRGWGRDGPVETAAMLTATECTVWRLAFVKLVHYYHFILLPILWVESFTSSYSQPSGRLMFVLGHRVRQWQSEASVSLKFLLLTRVYAWTEVFACILFFSSFIFIVLE